jgi:2-iminobutanoate/2-iminopropanoate deaminase
MKSVSSAHAPRPAGHYSQAIVHDGLVYVAGQLPLNPVTGHVVEEGDPDGQTERTLRNVEAILREAGTDLRHVLSMTIYVTGRDLWPAVNAAYARVMGEHRPARAIVPVPELKEGCCIEIQAVAALPDSESTAPGPAADSA